MKPNRLLSGLLCITLLGLTWGCGGGASVDTDPLESAFASAPPEVKGPVDQAVTALNNRDFVTGANALLAATKAGYRDFTEPQKAALYDIVERTQIVMVENPELYSGEVEDVFRVLVPAIEGKAPMTVPRMDPPEPNP
ncbi:MAG TPA: hypothetical protein VMS21_08240 [Methylomirabilota bacterium]|nr:hypothetical protein [Methylomirabilota bacterium]